MNSQPRVRISPAPPLSSHSASFQTQEDKSKASLVVEKTQETQKTSSKVRHQLRHSKEGFLTVAEVAGRLDKSVSTITRWCETGKIPAVAKDYGRKTSFLISAMAVELYLQEQANQLQVHQIPKGQAKALPTLPPSEWISTWKATMEHGLITGKPFSPITIKDYLYYAERFLKKHKHLNTETFRKALMEVPAEQFGKRFKLYKSLVCFAKFLIQNNWLDSEFLEQAKPLYPKRHTPPKRLVLTEEEIQTLIENCKTSEERLIVIFLSQTGLRASEACHVKLSDVDLKGQYLLVRRGKGGKQRRIGLTMAVVEAIQAYLMDTDRLEQYPANSYLLLDSIKSGLGRFGLAKRLEAIGNRAGVKVNPHALRRAFVTINANKGRPLQMLQMACGHSDIKTTMGYCRTSEQEVIDAMRGWD